MDYRLSYPAPLRWLSALIDVALAVGGIGIVVLTFVNAALRGTAGFDLAWSLEVTAFLLLWVTFVGCAAAVARASHMRVTEVVSNYVPLGWHRPIALVIDILIVAVMIALIFFGYAISSHTWAQKTTVLYWPVGLLYASMPVGISLCLIFHAANIVIDFRAPPSARGGPFARPPDDLKVFE